MVTGSSSKPCSGKSLRHSESEKSFAGLKKSESIIKSIPENDLVTARHEQPANQSSACVRRKEVLSIDRLKENFKAPVKNSETVTSAESGGSSGAAAPLYTRRTSSRQHKLRASSRQHADLTLSLKDNVYSQRITLESLSSNEAKMMSGLLQQASLEKLGTSTISNFSPVRTRKSSVAGYNNYHTMDDITNINDDVSFFFIYFALAFQSYQI